MKARVLVRTAIRRLGWREREGESIARSRLLSLFLEQYALLSGSQLQG